MSASSRHDRAVMVSRIMGCLELSSEGCGKTTILLAWMCGTVGACLGISRDEPDFGSTRLELKRLASSGGRPLDTRAAKALLAVVDDSPFASRLVDELDGGL